MVKSLTCYHFIRNESDYFNLLGIKNDYFKLVRDYKFRKYGLGYKYDTKTNNFWKIITWNG